VASELDAMSRQVERPHRDGSLERHRAAPVEQLRVRDVAALSSATNAAQAGMAPHD
jgi:hypothetical protein